MEEISRLYKDCADVIEEAYKDIGSAAQNFPTHYEGNGKILFDETASAIYDHLKLLETCTRAMGMFVDTAYESMRAKDVALSLSFNAQGHRALPH
jgi:hypothetical protein